MNRKFLAVLGILALTAALLPASLAAARSDAPPPLEPVDISSRLKDQPAPVQPYLDGVELPSGGNTTASQCPGGANEFLVITITSFDPANPGSQDVVFSAYALPYVELPERCLAEVRRVLALGRQCQEWKGRTR